MNYLLSAMGYGDCLISLSLLERLDADNAPVRVLGTEVTRRVSALLRKPVLVEPLISDTAAFYTVREKGLQQGFGDLLHLRGALRQLLHQGDRLGFERRMLAHRLLLPRGVTPIWAPATQSTYDDRRELVHRITRVDLPWKPCAKLPQAPRRVLLNPSARHASRQLDSVFMENLLNEGAKREWEVTLLDPASRYGQLRGRVARYLPAIDLEQAVQQLREVDLYIGPDSFFMHLAYYFEVPFLCFFLPNWRVFMPPGALDIRCTLSLETARDPSVLRGKLDEIGARPRQ